MELEIYIYNKVGGAFYLRVYSFFTDFEVQSGGCVLSTGACYLWVYTVYVKMFAGKYFAFWRFATFLQGIKFANLHKIA